MMTDNKKRILLAEDDQTLRGTLVAQLERRGYEVVAVENGEKLLEALVTDAFDLVLTDFDMQTEVNGLLALVKIRRDERVKHLQVIVHTATQSEIVKMEIAEAGGIYLSKKASDEFRYALIETWCGRPWKFQPA
jgi:CheY-like chemotaxis protein